MHIINAIYSSHVREPEHWSSPLESEVMADLCTNKDSKAFN